MLDVTALCLIHTSQYSIFTYRTAVLETCPSLVSNECFSETACVQVVSHDLLFYLVCILQPHDCTVYPHILFQLGNNKIHFAVVNKIKKEQDCCRTSSTAQVKQQL